MTSARVLFRGTLVFCLLLTVPVAARGLNKAKQLEEALKADYNIAHMGIDRLRITEPGTILVIQQEGITANPSSNFGNVTDKVIDGHVEGPKGVSAAFFSSGRDRSLKVGTTVYATRISVRNNEVQFDIVTCDTSDLEVHGNTSSMRYVATIAFQFPEGFLDTANADAVKKVVDAVLLPQAEMQAANTKTISLGQTIDQVKTSLGAPDRIVNLGPKVIYIYKDMKVIFQNGKVVDVQ